MLLPATRQPTICARFVVFKRFILTVMLESSVGKPELAGLAFRKSAGYTKQMASVHDVAKYILEQQGEMPAVKLQKLVYYSQAWHLVWADKPLFPERIEAWANGPVAPDLYAGHRGSYSVSKWRKGDIGNLTATERRSIDAILSNYGNKTAFWLSELSHQEAPWRTAREGLAPGERGSQGITKATMAEYYGSLV